MPYSEYLLGKYVQCPVGSKGGSGGSLRLYVPDIMPDIVMDEHDTWVEGLNSSIYNNASDCKPAISKRTQLQNFLTAMPPYDPFANGILYYGTTVQIEAYSEDVLTCRIRTLDIDNSTMV